jgi:hypothetical protein
MIDLQKSIKYLVGGAVALFAIADTNPALAVSFVSTFRPPGNITDVYQIDPTTGSTTFLSSSSLQLTDLAVNNSGQLFGTTYEQLYIINPGIETQSVVGNLTLGGKIITGFNGLAFDNKNNLFGLAGAPLDKDLSGNLPGRGFYKIDTTNGAVTLIAGLGALTPTTFGNGIPTLADSSDLVFDASTGKFFAVSGNTNAQLFSIDPDSGATTAIGTGTGFNLLTGLTIEGGVLRGYAANKDQIAIDTTTGLGTFERNYSVSIPILIDPVTKTTFNASFGGAASSPSALAATAVPEPSFVPGLLVVGGCLGARFVMKRKQRPLD